MLYILKYLLFSENKPVYRSIARKLKAGELRVYRLAHGKRAKNSRDYQILKELKKEGIIEGLLRV